MSGAKHSNTAIKSGGIHYQTAIMSDTIHYQTAILLGGICPDVPYTVEYVWRSTIMLYLLDYLGKIREDQHEVQFSVMQCSAVQCSAVQ